MKRQFTQRPLDLSRNLVNGEETWYEPGSKRIFIDILAYICENIARVRK